MTISETESLFLCNNKFVGRLGCTSCKVVPIFCSCDHWGRVSFISLLFSRTWTKNFNDDVLDFMCLIKRDASIGANETNAKEHFYLIKSMKSPFLPEVDYHGIISFFMSADE
jgi:hypothetical protein